MFECFDHIVQGKGNEVLGPGQLRTKVKAGVFDAEPHMDAVFASTLQWCQKMSAQK